MRILARTIQLGLTTALLLAGGGAALANSIVNVVLSDEGAGATIAGDLGMAMGGDKSKAVMKVAAIPSSATAGKVTFDVVNRSHAFVHEMIVVKVKDLATPLPYIAADTRVDEDAAGHLGEVSELDPGKSGSLTLTLDPGTYLLFCNIPGHYMAGMWTAVTVK